MSKLIQLFAFVVLTFSLTKCAKEETVTPKTKEMQVKQDTKTEMEAATDDQDNINIYNIDLIAAMAICNESFRIEMYYLQALNESGSFPDETDKTPKCFVRCVLQSTRIASEEGEYDPAQTAAVFGGEERVEKLATDCAKRDESCKCERAYQFMKCLMEKQVEEKEKPE